MKRTIVTCDFPNCRAKLKDVYGKDSMKFHENWKVINVTARDGSTHYIDVCPVHAGNVFWMQDR